MRALALFLSFAAVGLCFSQGTVNFANFASGAGGNVNAPVTNALVSPPVRLGGPGFSAQLYAGPAGTVNWALLSTNGISGAPATFLTGAQAGYFLGGVRTIDGYGPGTVVTLQVRVWNNAFASWETALPYYWGLTSEPIQVSLGDSSAVPNMVGLGFPSSFPIPEPSSFAFTAIGFLASAIFGVRRRVR